MSRMNTMLKVVLASVALGFTMDALADEPAGKVIRNTHELANGNTVEVVRAGRVDEDGNKRGRAAYRVTDAEGERIAAGITRGRADADGNKARHTHRWRKNDDGTVTRRHVHARTDGDKVQRRVRTTRR